MVDKIIYVLKFSCNATYGIMFVKLVTITTTTIMKKIIYETSFNIRYYH